MLYVGILNHWIYSSGGKSTWTQVIGRMEKVVERRNAL